MRYGAMNFPIRPVLEEIAAAGDLGMDFVELAMDPPEAHYQNLRRRRGMVRRALHERGLGLVCHLPTFVSLADLTASIRSASIRETIGSLETAVDLGAEKVVLHPGYIRGLALHVPDRAMALVLDSLAQVHRRAESLGIAICVENLFSALGPFVTPGDFQPIFEAFPGYKLVLDIGHAHLDDGTGRRSLDFIERFGGRLAHLHVSDNRGQADEHLPVGSGTIAFQDVAKALARAGYDGTATLEVFTDDRRRLVESRDRLEHLLTEARRGLGHPAAPRGLGRHRKR